MTDAREIMLAELPCNIVYGREQAVDGIIAALHSAGYRILGPGEWDKETVEKCADVAEAHSAELWPKARKPNRSELDVAIFESAASEADAIAAAIRAIGRKA